MIRFIRNCIQNILENKIYILFIIIYTFLVYSIYFYLDVETIIKIGREDGLIEYFTFFSFLGAFILFAKTFFVRKNIFFLLLAFVFLFGAGEEISWGQRIFSFSTPDSLNNINVQQEFNIHNIEIFNGNDFNEKEKTGLSLLLSINYLYRLFFLGFGIILPILALLNKRIYNFINQIRMPIPPLSIGIFFIINWGVYKLIRMQFLHSEEPLSYYSSILEVMESGSAFIFFILSLYFFKKENMKKNGLTNVG